TAGARTRRPWSGSARCSPPTGAPSSSGTACWPTSRTWSARRLLTRRRRALGPDDSRLRHFPIWVYVARMARAATTSDVFNAVAEERRRDILELLRDGELPATAVAERLGMTQPGTSKHLKVLREVGLVRDRRAGKQRLYALDARGLRAIHEWTGGFEQYWSESFDRLETYVQRLLHDDEEAQ